MEWMIGLALAGFAGLSARWNWWRLPCGGLPVLMYHKIGSSPRGSRLKNLWVTESECRWQLAYLKERGYTPIFFSQLLAAARGDAGLPEKPALLTFDDGYKNNYAAAHPILAEAGMKANMFVVTGSLDRHNYWHNPETEAWIPMLTLGDLKEMQKSGIWEFGSHTVNHPNLTEIPLEQAAWELRESKKRLEDALQTEVTSFGYPYGRGAYSTDVRREVFAAGYRMDFGIRQGKTPLPQPLNASHFQETPFKRLFIRGDDLRFDFHLNMTRGKARF